MKTIGSIFFLVLVSSFMMSCTEEFKSKEIQQIYFEYFYVNNAWESDYDHWIIDREGNVRSIKEPDSVINIDPADLNSYLPYFDTVLFTIDEAVLSEYVDLIKDAATGEIDSETRYWADYGKAIYNCFAKVNGRYETILLSEDSDSFEKENLDTGAKEIVNWLKGLNEEL